MSVRLPMPAGAGLARSPALSRSARDALPTLPCPTRLKLAKAGHTFKWETSHLLRIVPYEFPHIPVAVEAVAVRNGDPGVHRVREGTTTSSSSYVELEAAFAPGFAPRPNRQGEGRVGHGSDASIITAISPRPHPPVDTHSHAGGSGGQACPRTVCKASDLSNPEHQHGALRLQASARASVRRSLPRRVDHVAEAPARVPVFDVLHMKLITAYCNVDFVNQSLTMT